MFYSFLHGLLFYKQQVQILNIRFAKNSAAPAAA
jgi:hypothetical protein